MKNLHLLGALLLASALAFTGCGKNNPAGNVKSNGLPKAGNAADSSNCPVAIVDIDSLAAKYQYCIEGQKQLAAKQQNYQKQLNAKGQALQNAMVNAQKKLQSGGFTSEQQAQAEQTKLQNQQQQLQKFQEKIEKEMSQATNAYQETLRDSLRSFLKAYNADRRYKIILSKSGDNVLYTDPSVDITADVVAGLNQRYNKK